MKDVHRSKQIDDLMGQYVKITFFDGDVMDCWLIKYEDGKYYARNGLKEIAFRKSHIKSIVKK